MWCLIPCLVYQLIIHQIEHIHSEALPLIRITKPFLVLTSQKVDSDLAIILFLLQVHVKDQTIYNFRTYNQKNIWSNSRWWQKHRNSLKI